MAGNFLGNCLCTLFGAGLFVAGCCILLVTAFPIVQIVIGAVYMNDCPLAPMIPVFVLVCGAGALLILSLLALPNLLCPTREASSVWILWMLSLGLLYFCWFVYGSYHIYVVYPPHYTGSSSDLHNLTSAAGVSSLGVETPSTQNQTELGCHRTLYLFSFWTTTLLYIFAGNALVMLICLCGAMKLTEKVVKYLTT